MSIKLEEIWEQILAMEEDDPPIRLSVDTLIEANRIKASLSLYKHRRLNADPALKEALGKFRLIYSTCCKQSYPNKKIELSITIDTTLNKSGEMIFEAEQINQDRR